MQQRYTQLGDILNEALSSKYKHRPRQFWSSELLGKNGWEQNRVTNILAALVLLYTFDTV